jgi:hypothetical protein
VLYLFTRVRVEDASMRLIRPRTIACVVGPDPLLKVVEHSVLLLERRELLGLPRTMKVVRQTSIKAWIEKDEFSALRGRGLHEFAVTPLDDPGAVSGQEFAK